MKKILFNDRYGLTQAVLEGRKTQTRRIISANLYNRVDWKAFEEGNYDCIITDDASAVTDIRELAAYRVGEEVAVAQRYLDFRKTNGDVTEDFYKLCCENFMPLECLSSHAGAKNKMFVDPKLMPHRIRITNVRVERLKDISDEDCLKEGIDEDKRYSFGNPNDCYSFDTPRDAFAALIDKTCGKGTWDSNPYVFVYDFKLVR